MKELSKKQEQIISFIENFINSEGMSPTITEIANAFQITSPTAFAHIRSLQQKGYISRSNKARSLTLLNHKGTSSSYRKRVPFSIKIPILGRISAGLPLLAESQIEGEINIDPTNTTYHLSNNDELFALRINGESMRDAGILDGDIVIAQKNNNPRKGDIVIALTEDDATVKYFYVKNDKIELRPANPDFEPQYYEFGEIKIQGIVVGLQRTY